VDETEAPLPADDPVYVDPDDLPEPPPQQDEETPKNDEVPE